MTPSATPAPPPGAARRRSARAALVALAVAAVVLAAALWWTDRRGDLVELVDPSIETLDTVAVAGRRVVAHVGGAVTHVDADGTAWVGTADHAFAVRGAEAESLAVEDRVLVVGRLRESGGARWLDAEALTRVRSETLGAGRRSGERATVQPED